MKFVASEVVGDFVTESGIAGSAVIVHPYNDTITTVLQRTAHLRPTDGEYPLFAPLQSPLPLGPAPAIPTITTFRKKQGKKNRGLKWRNASDEEKELMAEGLKVLDQREEILRAELEAETPISSADIHDELKRIAKARGQLKKKAWLKDVEGKRVDRLAERLTKAPLADPDKTADWLAKQLTKVAEECMNPDPSMSF